MLKKNLPAVLLVIILLSVYVIYSFGFSGVLYYDDFRPLGALEQVKDFPSAMHYVLNETSGPLGRPISMVSFLVNINDWNNNNLSGFFRVNVIIHLINGLLVYLITYKLFNLIYSNIEKNKWLALSVSFLWLISPLLISTQLIAVQRMTSLSGLFLYIGLLGYLKGLEIQRYNEKKGLITQFFSIFICTLLAMFSKENGILLPVFVLVLEFTIIKKYYEVEFFRKIRICLGLFCLFVILLYLASTLRYADISYSTRNYSLFERIITEPQILLDYIKLAFIPNIFSYNPFHDNYPKNTVLFGNLFAIFSVVTWFLFLILSLVFRKKYVVFSFAILWFLAAHLLESTVIGLELYFEHRNYIAILGFYFLFIYLINELSLSFPKLNKILWGIFTIYIICLCLVNAQITSLWGKPELAAKSWFVTQVGSARAAEHLASMWLENGEFEKAHHILDIQRKNCPNCLTSQIQYLMVVCIQGQKVETVEQLNTIKSMSNKKQFILGAPSALQALFMQVENKQCLDVSMLDLKEINTNLIKNTLPVGLGKNDHLAMYVNLYQIAQYTQDEKSEWSLLMKIWELSNETGTGTLILKKYMDTQQVEKAKDFYNNQLCNVKKSKKFDDSYHQTCTDLKEKYNF